MTPEAPPPGGPLAGLRVVELAGLGPAPFCAMLLADLGADVVRLERAGQPPPRPDVPDRRSVLTRGRPSVGVDLKHPDGAALVLRLVEEADVLVEGFRPGVMERLGLGPEACLGRNPRLVYGRVTGYGRDGPLSEHPGHDVNYLALAGVLSAVGRAGEPPVPPLNLVGDFGGGAMLLTVGILAALVERARSGRGQVVDAAMVDGAALLATMVFEMGALGQWRPERGTNVVDTGAPYYEVYETADGRYVAVGAVEPAFYRAFMRGLGYDEATMPHQGDRASWPEVKKEVAARMRSRTRAAWLAIFDGTDACVTPVLSLTEAPSHPHNRHRGTFVEVDGGAVPAPAPRFSRTPAGGDVAGGPTR
ncbi:MAG: CoA transferase, partial [Acidobacteriota bacterium]|nr:CoA transferase [Acidobacteriota bacterium]